MAEAHWTHPTLGTFSAHPVGWSADRAEPAFKVFSHDTKYAGARQRTSGEFALCVFWLTGAAPDDPPPPAEMVAALERVMSDPQRLVATVLGAMWEDFNGRGPHSGNWWHGELAAVSRAFRDGKLRAPERAEDVAAGLRLNQVTIWNEWHHHPSPVAVMTFHAVFEPEHGFSVLTDGDAVLGTGFADDVYPWQAPAQPPRPSPFDPVAATSASPQRSRRTR